MKSTGFFEWLYISLGVWCKQWQQRPSAQWIQSTNSGTAHPYLPSLLVSPCFAEVRIVWLLDGSIRGFYWHEFDKRPTFHFGQLL